MRLLYIILISSLFCKYTYCPMVSITGSEVTNLATCDQRYALEMQQVLETLRTVMDEATLRLAQEYMLLIKQYQDLDFRIRTLERAGWNTETVAVLRMPLQRFQRCLDTVRFSLPTGTFATTTASITR